MTIIPIFYKVEARFGFKICELPRGGVLPSKGLLRMCCWMGSHFHNWTDYNGVTFLVELQYKNGVANFQDFG